MKNRILFIAFALLGFQLGFAQEIKPIVTDSVSIVSLDLTKQRILGEEALKEKEQAAKALKDAEKDRKKAQKELNKAEKSRQKAEKERAKAEKFGTNKRKSLLTKS